MAGGELGGQTVTGAGSVPGLSASQGEIILEQLVGGGYAVPVRFYFACYGIAFLQADRANGSVAERRAGDNRHLTGSGNIGAHIHGGLAVFGPGSLPVETAGGVKDRVLGAQLANLCVHGPDEFCSAFGKGTSQGLGTVVPRPDKKAVKQVLYRYLVSRSEAHNGFRNLLDVVRNGHRLIERHPVQNHQCGNHFGQTGNRESLIGVF